MAVSFIQSLYGGFGSGIVAPGTGVVLQNRGACFAVRRPASSRAGGPYHTIIPGMLLRDGGLRGPFGVMGGYIQAQAHMQLVSALVDDGLDPQAALDRPRFLVDGDVVRLEEGLWERADELERVGISDGARDGDTFSVRRRPGDPGRGRRAVRRIRRPKGRLCRRLLKRPRRSPTTVLAGLPAATRPAIVCPEDGAPRSSSASCRRGRAAGRPAERRRRRARRPRRDGAPERAGDHRDPARAGAARRGRRAAQSRVHGRRVRLLPRGPGPAAAAAPSGRGANAREAASSLRIAELEPRRVRRAASRSTAASCRAAERFERRHGRRHRAAAAHERHDEPAQAGAAAPAATSPTRRARSPTATGSVPTTSPTARCRSSTSTALVASTLAALVAGGTVVVPRRYTSRGFWSQAREHAITWVSAGPTTHQMALDAPRR